MARGEQRRATVTRMTSRSAPFADGPEGRAAFVRAHTALAPVPMVTDIRLYTATELVPIWRATENWLEERGLGVPFWCVPWAGGQALARYILENPDVVRGKRVLDFGAGSGLIAIAAAKAGAAEVRAVDVDPIAEVACALNAEANGVTLEVATRDIVGAPLPEIDVVLAGDVWFERAPAARFRRWFERLAGRGLTILTSDAGRHYAPRRARELARYEVPTPFDLEAAATRMTRVLAIEPPPPRSRR